MPRPRLEYLAAVLRSSLDIGESRDSKPEGGVVVLEEKHRRPDRSVGVDVERATDEAENVAGRLSDGSGSPCVSNWFGAAGHYPQLGLCFHLHS